jgi:hypothetical protein
MTNTKHLSSENQTLSWWGFCHSFTGRIHRTGLILSKRNIWVSSSIVDFVVELKAIAAFLAGYGGGGV